MTHAAESYKCAADCRILLKDDFKAAVNLNDAALQYIKDGDSASYAIHMKRAVELSLNAGNFNRAAVLCKSLAEYYEKTTCDLTEALVYYEKTAEYYEGSSSSRTKALLSVAQLSSQLEQYDRAIELYESIAAASLDSIVKCLLRTIFFKAGICRLCNGDTVAACRAIDNYLVTYPTFASARE